MRPIGIHDDKEKDLTHLRITELGGNSLSPLERLNWFESNNPYYPPSGEIGRHKGFKIPRL